ncbi:OLC1v1022902C1 [Oldenlandia corymbosa var. corymbosa]|uniref:OLC1v1022902C1 n=1 Tax=Oldenlandia corymbosa var. corymbosa TaxID=529605 RepID=A0AAV1BZL5_OLDCO|nr:OLC1v1022902C1 [Oldenlandia corymbosa var. corymbosa]
MASKLLMIAIFIIDLIAFGLAVAAEQRRSTATTKPDSEKYYDYCVYDSDIATGYGLGAFFMLMLSQVIIMFASKCFCCGKALKPGGSRACAVLLLIICWVFFLIAEACLLAGSVRNAYHTKYRTMFNVEDPPSCETVRKGVFAAGAAFVFLTAIISEFYYVSFSNSRQNFEPYGGQGAVGMASY